MKFISLILAVYVLLLSAVPSFIEDKCMQEHTTEQGQNEQDEAIRGYLIQYPELRKYFFENVNIAYDDKDYSRVVSIAEVYLNYLEQIAVLKKKFRKGKFGLFTPVYHDSIREKSSFKAPSKRK